MLSRIKETIERIQAGTFEILLEKQYAEDLKWVRSIHATPEGIRTETDWKVLDEMRSRYRPDETCPDPYFRYASELPQRRYLKIYRSLCNLLYTAEVL
jgi:hypothetical protein|tara:strand:+ start:3745 stop:4038 length:294 start_codon:yes stop_codon:yes gene_type:complete